MCVNLPGSNTVHMIKSCMIYEALTGKLDMYIITSFKYAEGKDCLGDLDMILGKKILKMWTGFKRFRIASNVRFV